MRMNAMFDQIKAEAISMSINSFKMELSNPPTTKELLARASEFYDFMVEVQEVDNVSNLKPVQ